jgi:casein kinase 1
MGHNDSSLLYLIDFGLTTRFMDENGVLVKKEQLGRFSGNFLFASLNSCRGYNKGRRDDIESAFYILIYLINGKSLPWSNFDTKFKD